MSRKKYSIIAIVLFSLICSYTGLVGLAPNATNQAEAKNMTPYPATDSNVVVITHAQLGSNIYYNLKFWYHTFLVASSLRNHAGYVGHKLDGKFLSGDAWTLTAWRSEHDMNRFMQNKVHRRAMRNGMKALKLAEFARIKITSNQWPVAWPEARDVMLNSGYKLPLAHK